jgi:hypothetical protein
MGCTNKMNRATLKVSPQPSDNFPQKRCVSTDDLAAMRQPRLASTNKDLTYREAAAEAKAFGSLVCDNQRMNG